MSNTCRVTILFVLAVFVAACAAPATSTLLATNAPPATSPPTATDVPSPSERPEVQIARHPEPTSFMGLFVYTKPPKYNPASSKAGQVDLRSSDLTKLDLSQSKEDLLFADFDSKTHWPAADKMPVDFDWQKIMEIGKDPGLGLRALHDQGINGQNIGIAIIDQPLLVDHQEYKDRLRLYEEINILPNNPAAPHGAAVASIAAGKTVGVAPEADIYYIGAWTGDWEPSTNNFTWNYKYHAQAVHRILEINQGLPDDRKIRVITMQVGWVSDRAGYDEIVAAVDEAKAAGIFVISSSLFHTYKLYFHGLGREPLDDPNQFESYRPGLWWEKDFFNGRPSELYSGLPSDFYSKESMEHLLLVPMDSRTTASPTGTEDYVYYRQGGWSWSIPYLGGMYALAAQVKPDITPEEFWNTALETGRTIQIQHDGKDYEFGVILDPQALIEALMGK